MSVQVSSKSINLGPVREARVNAAVPLRGEFLVSVFNDSPTAIDIQLDGQLDGGAGFSRSDTAHKTVAPNQMTTIHMQLWVTAYYSESGRACLTGQLQLYDRNNWQTIDYDTRSVDFHVLPE
jgi:hypothetical protein